MTDLEKQLEQAKQEYEKELERMMFALQAVIDSGFAVISAFEKQTKELKETVHEN